MKVAESWGIRVTSAYAAIQAAPFVLESLPLPVRVVLIGATLYEGGGAALRWNADRKLRLGVAFAKGGSGDEQKTIGDMHRMVADPKYTAGILGALDTAARTLDADAIACIALLLREYEARGGGVPDRFFRGMCEVFKVAERADIIAMRDLFATTMSERFASDEVVSFFVGSDWISTAKLVRGAPTLATMEGDMFTVTMPEPARVMGMLADKGIAVLVKQAPDAKATRFRTQSPMDVFSVRRDYCVRLVRILSVATFAPT